MSIVQDPNGSNYKVGKNVKLSDDFTVDSIKLPKKDLPDLHLFIFKGGRVLIPEVDFTLEKSTMTFLGKKPHPRMTLYIINLADGSIFLEITPATYQAEKDA